MTFRPRRSTFTREQWAVHRERFQLDDDAVPPTTNATTAIKKPVEAALASFGIKSDSVQRTLMDHWNTIAGHPLCRHIRPGPINRGVLTIYATNSVIMAELRTAQGHMLLRKIQAATGPDDVKKLVFQIDPDTRSMTQRPTT
ncbi:MAG TPA: DUF721 domain-containing protein [Kiritimatiellia bacterium]|nr:DUF721 domain-containing protein [Kiritimatiellia bacterium]HMP34105.1 DUF721 domain-containing protein [Kiritimatiellia bacterium]